MSSSVNCGKSSMTLAWVIPAASQLSTSYTVMRVSRTHGLPKRRSGSMLMSFWYSKTTKTERDPFGRSKPYPYSTKITPLANASCTPTMYTGAHSPFSTCWMGWAVSSTGAVVVQEKKNGMMMAKGKKCLIMDGNVGAGIRDESSVNKHRPCLRRGVACAIAAAPYPFIFLGS